MRFGLNATRSLALGLSLVFSLGFERPASAQSSSDSAAAEVLFRRGRDLMKAGDYNNACAALDQSQRLDPAGGTLFALGDCLDAQGKTASAWGRFREALEFARRSNNASRIQQVSKRINELETRLSKLVVVVPPAVAALEGLEVLRDHVAIGQGAWGVALPIDPGDHQLEVHARGKQPWSRPITIGPKADAVTITVPPLVERAAAPATPAASSVTETPSTPPPSSASDGTTQRIIGGITMGVGAASLVAALIVRGQINSNADKAQPHCPPVTTTCDDAGHDFYTQARHAYYTAWGLGLGGGAVVAIGGILVLTAPHQSNDSARNLWLVPHATLGSLGVSLGGTL